VRLDAAGALDPSFSGDGRKVLRFGARSNAADVVLQPDGKILVGGTIAPWGRTRGWWSLASTRMASSTPRSVTMAPG